MREFAFHTTPVIRFEAGAAARLVALAIHEARW